MLVSGHGLASARCRAADLDGSAVAVRENELDRLLLWGLRLLGSHPVPLSSIVADFQKLGKPDVALEVLEKVVFRDAEGTRKACTNAPCACHVAPALDVTHLDTAEDASVSIHRLSGNLVLSHPQSLAK